MPPQQRPSAANILATDHHIVLPIEVVGEMIAAASPIDGPAELADDLAPLALLTNSWSMIEQWADREEELYRAVAMAAVVHSLGMDPDNLRDGVQERVLTGPDPAHTRIIAKLQERRFTSSRFRAYLERWR